jgi:hypothetical protein
MYNDSKLPAFSDSTPAVTTGNDQIPAAEAPEVYRWDVPNRRKRPRPKPRRKIEERPEIPECLRGITGADVLARRQPPAVTQ